MAKAKTATDNTVRVRVLRGAITFGTTRIEKGHTFECAKPYAEHLIGQMPDSYAIVPTKEKDTTTTIKQEAQSGDDI